MASAYTQVTHENLESLAALGRDTPPPTSPQAASDAVVEKFRVRSLMTALQRHRAGCQYLRELDIEEHGFDGILYRGSEPTLADLEDLTRNLRAKVDMLKPHDPPAQRLEEAKNSVLNVLLELLYGGLSYHLVLAQEQDVVIGDYANPEIRFNGRKKDHDSPTWWESKHTALSIQRDEAKRSQNVLIPQKLQHAVQEIGERLAEARRLFKRLATEDGRVNRWVESGSMDPRDRRKRESDEEDTVSTYRAKRRRLAGEAAVPTGAKQPAAAATPSLVNTTVARTDVTPSGRSARKPIRRVRVPETSHRAQPTAANTLGISSGNQGAPDTQQHCQTRKNRTRPQAGAVGEQQRRRLENRTKFVVTRSGVRKPDSISGGRVRRSGRARRKPLRYPCTELREAMVWS